MRVSERAAALAHAQNLFSELSTLTSHSPRHRACRDELIEMHLPLVRYLARRFRNRGAVMLCHFGSKAEILHEIVAPCSSNWTRSSTRPNTTGQPDRASSARSSPPG